MSTRGAIGFKIKGKMVQMYNHCDSYPEGLGVETIRALIEVVSQDRMEEFETKLAALEAVDSSGNPTHAEAKFYNKNGATDRTVGNGDDWYATLRNFQGANCIPAILNDRMKHYCPYDPFDEESWDCEYAYIADLDKGTFKVYEDPHKKSSRPKTYKFKLTSMSATKFQLEKILAEITKSEEA